MITNARICIVLSALVGSTLAISGFWLGRATARPTIVQSLIEVASTTTPAGPAELAATLHKGRTEQAAQAEKLLAWCEQLRKSSKRVTIEDRKLVYHAVKLFGELRYTPAVSFLVYEAFHHTDNVGCIGPSGIWGWDEVPPLEESDPHLAALSQIGAPASAPLVEEYVRLWKLGGPKAITFVSTLEYFLTQGALPGPVLLHIEKRLLKADHTVIDRDELDALQHLKRELLKPFE